MIDALAGTRLERKATRYESAVGGAKGIQNGLGEIFWPDVRRERFAIDNDVDAACGFIREDLDSRCGCAVLFCEGEAENYEGCDRGCGGDYGCGVAHGIRFRVR